MTRRHSIEEFGPERVSKNDCAADDLILLAEVVDAGGFGAASLRTGVSKSRLSRRIATLEEQLGVTLLLRNSRNFEVTEIGRQLYQHGRRVRAETYAATTLAKDNQGEPYGTLRVACPTALVSEYVGRIASEFALANPRVRICLNTTMGTAASQASHADLVLVPSVKGLPDSDMIVQRLAVFRYVLVATPAVAEAAGRPVHPNALEGVDAIGWGGTEESVRWHLEGPGQEHVEVETRVRFSSDNLMVICEAALAGLGVARLPEALCRPYIEKGRLCVVTPGWAPPSGSIRIFVGKAVEQLLSPCLGKSIAEHNGKLIHRGFPVEGSTH
ncbi:LysR family transcriptional regulator, partial [Eoetvoesia caeni]|nr:LysR family transcriptional regulator [Eoetvoesiella caeni]